VLISNGPFKLIENPDRGWNAIQEELLFLPKTVSGPDRITEKALRQVARSIDWEWQKKQFRALGQQAL
jgi:hypothetical protein